MSMRCVVVVGGLIIAHSTFGQASENTGPGGVGNNAGTSSLVVWLAADKGVVFNSKVDNSIFQLSDLSGYANHAIRYDRAASPTLIPNALNGMPLARFDGIDDYLSIVSNASIELKQWSFFLVAKVNKHKDFNCFFVKGRDGEENFEFLSYADAKVQFPIRYTNNERSNDVFADGVSNTVFRIYQYDNDNINLTHYANLAQKFTKAEPRIPNSKTLMLWRLGMMQYLVLEI